MPKLNGASEKSSHIEALGKAKPHPYFQILPTASKKKKPLSRRDNHALIAANYVIVIITVVTIVLNGRIRVRWIRFLRVLRARCSTLDAF